MIMLYLQLACIVILCAGRVTASSTYNLYLDGILSPDAANQHARNDNAKESARTSAPSPPMLLTELSVDFMNDIIHVYSIVDRNATSENMSELSQGLDAKECVVAKDDISCIRMASGLGGSCIAQHISESGDLDVHVVARLQKGKKDTTFRAEVMMTAPTAALARETLTQMVSRVNHKPGWKGNFVWSIQHQPSAMETLESSMKNTETVVADQERKDRRAASIEEIILGNALMKNRTRLEYVYNSHLLELWSYEDVKFRQPIKSLFIDGYLATTTSPAGVAHAEAMVHPAMVAHPSPTRALVLSLTPNAVVKEILKYKSIKHVSVVGSDAVASELIGKHMPGHCDCGFLGPEDSKNCMECAAVQVIKEDLYSWLNGQEKSFDVIFVDVPIGKHEWLSTELYGKLDDLSPDDSDSIIVVSSGSMPSLFDVDTETILSPRETLIRHLARDDNFGGLDCDTLLYDEVSCFVSRHCRL